MTVHSVPSFGVLRMNISYERLLAEIARRDNRLIYAMISIAGLVTAIFCIIMVT